MLGYLMVPVRGKVFLLCMILLVWGEILLGYPMVIVSMVAWLPVMFFYVIILVRRKVLLREAMVLLLVIVLVWR